MASHGGIVQRSILDFVWLIEIRLLLDEKVNRFFVA
jgi:hypothetical protein